MARARGGGGSGAAWALVLLGAGFVICLVLAILFSVQLTSAQEARAEAEEELSEYVGTQERRSPIVTAMLESGEGTVVGQLLESNEALRGIIGVGPDETLDAVRQQVDAAAGEDAGALLQEVQALRAEVDAAEERLASERQALERAREAAAAADREKNQLQQQYEQAEQRLAQGYDARVSTAESEVTALRNNLSDLENQLDQVRSRLQQRVDNLQSEVASLEDENENLRRILDDMRRREAGGDAVPVTSPDGTIASVLEESDLVFIDRGRRDQMLLGLTFEVFEKGKPITFDEAGENRGAATIQVVEINEASSLARVVRRSQGAFIREGDSIVNIVYDPNRTFRFRVFGAFNLDGEGDPSFAQQQKIEDIIERWDGVVADELTFSTDFLVLGAEPEPPDPLSPDVIDPERIAEFNEQKRIYDTYQELVTEAERLRIPVLNQNRFLTLIGYYQR